ncbi:cupin domain-containing protein [Silvibacterium dinghuense]|uniref:Cupin domain-containing protein n=1 Tax=Silvibacterium dinghuense TaxID=1560006 RepID=A0A4Q1S996_9BACT|nr:cupin domain-containing protein [Silvibacterium dinghuense]RXS93453.1 cupin domain-containing protein [Silvibacterium dinghuense]GGH05968.1 hypothetical protein GCM10011586_22710 [Silvibacterium dinghuense]
MTRLSAEELKQKLSLEPHPCEGGWFRQIWQADETIAGESLPPRYAAAREQEHAARVAGTCIYYLLEPGTFSEMHRLASDEIFHFYYGDPVEMLQIAPDGRAERFLLGSDLAEGQHCQLIVPKHTWQGSRLVTGGECALLGCTVSPGFDYADYESGTRASLAGKAGEFEDLLLALTRE